MSKYNNIPVFIINMPSRLERKEHMKSLMNQLGFTNYTFVVPYNADENTKELLSKEIGQPFNLSVTKASHNMTYLSLLKLQHVDDMFILEDDIIITKPLENIKNELDIIVNNHPQNADMIYMEMCFEKCGMNKINGFVKLENPMCTAALYYPSKKSRDYIVNSLKNNINFSNQAMDSAFNELINSGQINAYMYNLLFIQDNNFGSDIEGSIGFDSEYKPMLPTCSSVEETIEYFNIEDYKDEIKKMYEYDMAYQMEQLRNEMQEEINNLNNNTTTNNKKNTGPIIFVIILFIILFAFILTKRSS